MAYFLYKTVDKKKLSCNTTPSLLPPPQTPTQNHRFFRNLPSSFIRFNAFFFLIDDNYYYFVQINIKLKSEMPVQIDGEPWMQPPGNVIVRPILTQVFIENCVPTR